MMVFTPSPNHTDERGEIMDLAGRVDAVTVVHTKKGAVRGNHFHSRTEQWTYVASGRLLVTNGKRKEEVGPGVVVYDGPGSPHAWRALEDTVCVVFVKGPRAGNNYEADTTRLEIPLIVSGSVKAA
jgi:quercetin dioxygenase-like cupin family protein